MSAASYAYGLAHDRTLQVEQERDEARAENARLREALEPIARAEALPHWARQVAGAALAETQETAE